MLRITLSTLSKRPLSQAPPPPVSQQPPIPAAKFSARLAAAGLLVATLIGAVPAPALAAGRTIWVDPASRRGHCSDHRARAQVSARRPVCSLAGAARAAVAGDTVRVGRATYHQTLVPLRSGTPRRPIRWLAERGTVLDARGRGSGINVRGRHDLAFDGFTVTRAGRQGVWVQNSARVTLTHLVVRGNRGAGIQLRGTSLVTVRGSSVIGNFLAGIQELGGTRYTRILANRISGNGKARASFNGDGVQLAGHGARVSGNVIEANGTNPTWEHGIYASVRASGYLIDHNRLRGNAGANIKAQGSGTVRYNTMRGGRLAMYVSSNSGGGLSVFYNVASGAYADAVVVGTGGRVRIWNNTLVNSSTTAKAQPTALLVSNALALDLRNNLLVTKGGDGRAVAIPAPGRLRTLRADHNWYTTPDTALPTAFGQHSLSIDDWRAATHQDGSTILTPPPALTADARPVGDNPGAGAGMPLGFAHDVANEPVPSSNPSIGAYQS
jgi:hypothetical protein